MIKGNSSPSCLRALASGLGDSILVVRTCGSQHDSRREISKEKAYCQGWTSQGQTACHDGFPSVGRTLSKAQKVMNRNRALRGQNVSMCSSEQEAMINVSHVAR